MLGKDGLAGTPCSTIAAKFGFGGARPPGEPPNAGLCHVRKRRFGRDALLHHYGQMWLRWGETSGRAAENDAALPPNDAPVQFFLFFMAITVV